MKQKKLLLGIVLMVSCAAVGCSGYQKSAVEGTVTQGTEVLQTTSGIEEETTEDITENIKTTMKSTGVLSEFTNEDVDGFGNKMAYFKGIDNVDFIAILSSETELPEELIIGETYDVFHSNIQTMSIPPQYPQVSKIVVTDQEESEASIDSIEETADIVD
jgi:hypothetical protein